MSQTQSEGKLLEKGIEIMEEGDQTSNVGFRFNAQAPEFVPRLTTTTTTTTTTLAPVPVSGYFYPCVHFLGGSSSSPEWFYIEDHHEQPLSPNYWVTNHNINTITTTNNNNNNNNNNNIITNNNNNSNNVPMSPSCSKNANNHNINTINNNSNSNVIPDELQHKIIKQVEYQLSDISLLANETLSKQINKDPEGYVPISVIASTKKIKSLTCNNNMLAEALRGSPKLAVSDDGKKVRRKNPFTDKSKEEIQSRTIVAENLPDDHSHQNLEKIFRVAGSVKTVRVCHPQEANSSRSKGDFIVSNKLHALVEYESTDTAELAVEKLNDERNWRKGLRVRLLLRCSPKSVLKSRRSDFDGATDDDETPTSECADDTFHSDSMLDSSADENSPMKKGWVRVRGKGKGRGQSHIGRGLGLSASRPSSPMHGEASPRLGTKGPRMPDGTRGFTMGRGKPLSPLAPTTTLSRFS